MSRTELKLEFLGMSGINPFIANTSSARAVMDFNHFSQHLPLLRPDERLIKSGIEYELGKYINDVRVEQNCIVKAIVPRYREYGFEPPAYTVFVEFERDGHLFIDCIDVVTSKSSHNFFGYQLRPTEELSNLGFNSPLEEGTILAKADSYGRDGSYDFSLNANVAFMSHPSVSDDGFVISESFAERAKFTAITKRIININKNTIPLNLNGTEDVFKFIPDIGTAVRPDGLLCAIRDRNDWFSVSDMNNKNLSEVDVTFDNLTYVNPNSVVIDIKVTRGNYHKSEFLPKMTEQLDHYAEMLTNYYRNVTGQYESIMAEKKALYGTTDGIRMTPRLHRFITDSYIKVNMVTNSKNKLSYRKLPIDQYRIEITTMAVMKPNLGYKLSDVHAAKGVVCLILPDEKMPIDKNGNRVDVITDSTSTISRSNPGRTYEAYMGAVSRDNRQFLIRQLEAMCHGSYINNPTKEATEYARQYLRGLYVMINSEMTNFIDSLNEEELRNHIAEVVQYQLSIFYPPDNEKNITEVISDIDESPYRPLCDKLTYVDEFGRTVETTEDIRVGVFSVMFLEKIGNSYSAVSSAKVNNFGFPVKGTNTDKYRYPHSQTPTKVFSETDVRIDVAFMEPEAVADMMDLALNPNSHKAVFRSIIESDVAFNNNLNINREVIPYGETKSLQIMRHIFTAVGADFVYEKEEP